jgi:hypothetical protein
VNKDLITMTGIALLADPGEIGNGVLAWKPADLSAPKFHRVTEPTKEITESSIQKAEKQDSPKKKCFTTVAFGE